jgi:small GTP-binding protein
LLSEELSVRLLQDYDAVRQREVELVTHLMDILPRIDNLDQQWLNQLRDAMFHADHPYMMVFVGPFNSGKSSLINALVGRENLLKIGPTPVTDKVSILRYGEDVQPIEAMNRVQTVFYPAPLLKKVSLVDTPGLDSVFHEHEETTQKFLHRADIILLVMLATQAMTSSNLEYLKRFKQYGQKVILVVNQIDLLNEEEQQKVKQYVSDHSKDRLGFAPEVWMVSAKWGLEAQAQTPRDEALWERSNLGVFEAFVERQLNDANRLRQKLQTPLQIAKNAHQAAVETVKTNQERYDSYRLIGENIERQL